MFTNWSSGVLEYWSIGKKGTIFYSILCLLLSIFLISSVHADEISAENLLKHASVPNGIICVPDCGAPSTGSGQAGDLALELAQKSKFLVFAMDADAGNVAAAKDKAMKAGLLGRRLYVQQGSRESIPFADNYIDLLILNNLKNEDLTDKLAVEINRVLTPIHGTVLFSGSTGKKEIETFLKKKVFTEYRTLNT